MLLLLFHHILAVNVLNKGHVPPYDNKPEERVSNLREWVDKINAFVKYEINDFVENAACNITYKLAKFENIFFCFYILYKLCSLCVFFSYQLLGERGRLRTPSAWQ